MFALLLGGIFCGIPLGMILSEVIDKLIDYEFVKERKQMNFKIKLPDENEG